MKRTDNPNINTKIYWNNIYGTPDKREEYAVQGTSKVPFVTNNILIQPTKRFTTALEFIKDQDRVLDIGCGVGVFTSLVKRTYPRCEVWGTDISDKAIEDNKIEIPDICYIHQYIGDQDRLPSDYFDVVFSGEVLEHLDDPNDLFKDAQRVLKKGGKFILTTPDSNMIQSEEHTWEFIHEDIIKLYIDNGFDTPIFRQLPLPEGALVIFSVGDRL